MQSWLLKQNKIVQLLLLLIPPINWVVELIMRWSIALKHTTLVTVIVAILAFPFGVIIGWIDLVFVLLNNRIVEVK